MLNRYHDLARYNSWANRLIYDAVEGLSPEDFLADRGAFFRSVCGTLNHMLVADRIWMRRFTGSGEAPDRLDLILFEDLPALRAAREAEDARIVAYVDGLDEPTILGRFTYRTVTRPSEVEQQLAPALDHFFNHQTHHRGQVHCLLTQMRGEAPSLDLLVYQRETGRGGVTVRRLE